jgi:hypothetical protein
MNEHADFNDAEIVPPKTETPAIGLTFQQKYDDYRSVVFQSFVAADCQPAELNHMLDKLRLAAERQKAITHLPTYRGLLKDKQDGLKKEIEASYEIQVSHDEMLKRWDEEFARSGRRGPFKQSAAHLQEQTKHQQELAKARQNIEILTKEIAVHERLIADMEKLIADGG